MRILLTGSSGFIGSALTERLSVGNELFTMSRSKSNRANHFHINIQEENFSNKLPPTIDYVIHLIQSDSYGDFPDGAQELFRTNIVGSFQLLEWARKANVKRFIFASSGNVYKWGDETLNEKSEKAPDTFYGASKLAVEQLAAQYTQFFEFVALRPFTVYGPGQRKMTISNLLQRLMEEKKISIQGGEGPTFSPLYIDDCMEFFTRAVTAPLKERYLALNISGLEILSIKEMVDILSGLSGKSPLYVNSEGRPKCFASRSSLAQEQLGYVPRVSFQEGSNELFRWIKGSSAV